MFHFFTQKKHSFVDLSMYHFQHIFLLCFHLLFRIFGVCIFFLVSYQLVMEETKNNEKKSKSINSAYRKSCVWIAERIRKSCKPKRYKTTDNEQPKDNMAYTTHQSISVQYSLSCSNKAVKKLFNFVVVSVFGWSLKFSVVSTTAFFQTLILFLSRSC